VGAEYEQGETTGRLWLAGAGWALLTILLMTMLGFGLPVLLVGTLVPVLPRAGMVIAALVGAALTVATTVLLRRDTRRRYTGRPRLLRALLIGHTVAVVLSAPALLIVMGAALMAAFGG
jgi:hypothetical protein